MLLRVIFTLLIAQAMEYQYLKLIGGALLFYVAVKLVTEDADGEGEGVEAAHTLWRAVRIVAIADIVMSLDNVIAIAAAAETAAAAPKQPGTLEFIVGNEHIETSAKIEIVRFTY